MYSMPRVKHGVLDLCNTWVTFRERNRNDKVEHTATPAKLERKAFGLYGSVINDLLVQIPVICIFKIRSVSTLQVYVNRIPFPFQA